MAHSVFQRIRYVHEGAFDAWPELKNLLVDEGKAAIEADFVGTHSSELAGLAATGRAVRVPYSVVYDLRDDQIGARCIYLPMSLLMEQLANWVSPATGPGPTPASQAHQRARRVK